MATNEFLYFIVARPEGYKKDEYAVKIGTSNNVKETRQLLESAGWADLRSYAVFQGGVVADLERSAHEKFAAGSLKRGWFRIKKADLDEHIATLEMIEGIKYTQESKAKVGKRVVKKKEGGDDAVADAKPAAEPKQKKAEDAARRPEPKKPEPVEPPRKPETKVPSPAPVAAPPKTKPVWDEPKTKPKKTPSKLDEFDSRSLDWN